MSVSSGRPTAFRARGGSARGNVRGGRPGQGSVRGRPRPLVARAEPDSIHDHHDERPVGGTLAGRRRSLQSKATSLIS